MPGCGRHAGPSARDCAIPATVALPLHSRAGLPARPLACPPTLAPDACLPALVVGCVPVSCTQVGVGYLTINEQRAHFALWALLKSPLLIGADLRSIAPNSLAVLQAREVIAVNQDELGVAGDLIWKQGAREVGAGPPTSRPLQSRQGAGWLAVWLESCIARGSTSGSCCCGTCSVIAPLLLLSYLLSSVQLLLADLCRATVWWQPCRRHVQPAHDGGLLAGLALLAWWEPAWPPPGTKGRCVNPKAGASVTGRPTDPALVLALPLLPCPLATSLPSPPGHPVPHQPHHRPLGAAGLPRLHPGGGAGPLR